MEMSDVVDRLSSIENRLSQLEGKSATVQKVAAPVAPPVTAQVFTPPPISSLTSFQKDSVTTKPGNWLGIIGIICFILAAGSIIKLSIDSGWLTPERQIGLAALLGFALIGVGFSLMKKDREYASLLPGAGVIVLYLTCFAAHGFYSLIPAEVALALVGLVTAICIWLYIEIEHDAYAITAALGSYVAPTILGFNKGTDFSVYYFVLCSVAFATISIWVKSRFLTVISAYLAIVMTGSAGFYLAQDSMIAGMLLLQFLIFTLGTFLYSKTTGNPLTKSESISFLPVLLIFYAFEYYFMNRLAPDLTPWISLGCGAVVMGLYFLAKKSMSDKVLNSQSMLMAFVTVVVFHSVYLVLLPDEIRPWLFSVMIVAAVLAPWKISGNSTKGEYVIPQLALLAIMGIEFIRIISKALTVNDPYWMILALVSSASIWFLLTYGRAKVKDEEATGSVLLGAAHVLAVLGLYRLTADVGSLAVSASWLFYALAVIAVAYKRKDIIMGKSALAVLSFAAAKALLYDVSMAAPIIRIFCLLLTGAVLYFSGFVIRKMSDWKT